MSESIHFNRKSEEICILSVVIIVPSIRENYESSNLF